jgi:hypothetical protein
VLYTGDGTNNRSITGLGFDPDFTWIKSRSNAYSNALYDSIRGNGAYLISNDTAAENGYGTFNWTNAGTSTDGFIVDYGTNASINGSGSTFVAWNWKANGSGVSNTDGSITSTVSANTDAGFSIVTFTSPATSSTAFTVGHGLSSAPEMIITKERDGTLGWLVYSDELPSPKDNYLLLNSTAGNSGTVTDCWGPSVPTSSVFGMKTTVSINTSKSTIAYCFHSVDGFSKFGSYTGNGSTDGPFVYTGFRPAFVMIKRTDAATFNWHIYDATRSEYNPLDNVLLPNISGAEENGYDLVDSVSNGFKLRIADRSTNTSGGTYIYMAFAEMPAKYSLGR